ncbi:MAG: hypothetical protein ACKVOO_06035 [Burkholderiaceae bacterium]
MQSDTRWLLRGTAAAALLLLACAIAWTLDTRTLNGVSVWSKPLKFNLSFALHLLTLAWLIRHMAPVSRSGGWALLAVRTVVIATLIELLYISFQAARGRQSHFNFETQWETAAYYALMGGAALAVVFATAVLGWLLWRHPRAGLAAGVHWGAALGLMVGSIATLVTAGALASGAVAGPVHWVGGVHSDAAGLPLFGWSSTGGDLRVPHFFATHLTQALPLAGWLAGGLPWARASVATAALLGIGVVVLTFSQALAGRAFIPL